MIEGQIVKNKITGKTEMIEGVRGHKIKTTPDYGKTHKFVSLDTLELSEDLKEEITKSFNSRTNRVQKEMIEIYGVNDYRRAPEEILDGSIVKCIHKGDCFGKNSRVVYESFCNNSNYEWDTNLSKKFGDRGRRLFARNATKEGYAVWMLAYSSLNGKALKSGRVTNKLQANGDIVEIYNDDDHKHFLGEIRAAFVKNKDEQYIFWGLVQTESITEKEVKHTYISDKY